MPILLAKSSKSVTKRGWNSALREPGLGEISQVRGNSPANLRFCRAPAESVRLAHRCLCDASDSRIRDIRFRLSLLLQVNLTAKAARCLRFIPQEQLKTVGSASLYTCLMRNARKSYWKVIHLIHPPM